MPGDRSVLELAVEAADLLRGFEQIENRAAAAFKRIGTEAKSAADITDAEFDQVDLRVLEGEARALLSRFVEIGERGDAAFRELRAGVQQSASELKVSDEVAAKLQEELRRVAQVQREIGKSRDVEALSKQLAAARTDAALLRGQLQASEAAEKRTGQAQGTKELRAQIRQTTTRADLLEQQIKKVRLEEERLRQSQGIGGLLKRIGAARIAALGLVASLAAVTIAARRIGTAIVEATAEQELQDRKLAAALETLADQGDLALKSLKADAAAFQDLTTTGDEAVEAVQALIVRISQLNDRSVLRQATGLSLDLATALGQNVDAAATQVAKSLALLGGSTTEVTTAITNLRRAGIVLGAESQERIKQLAAENQTLEAQKVLLGELQSRYGGAAAAARDTLQGSVLSLRNAFGDLLEVVGQGGLGDALKDVAERLQSIVENSDETAESLGALLGTIIKFTAAVGAIPLALGKVRNDLTDIATGADDAGAGLRDLTDVYRALGSALAAGDLDQATRSLTDIVGRLAELGDLARRREEVLVYAEEIRASYVRAGKEASPAIELLIRSLKSLGEQAQKTAAEVKSGAEQVAEALQKAADQQGEFVAGLEEDLDSASQKLFQFFKLVQESTGGDLRQATEAQLTELRKLADEVVSQFELLGKKVPEEVEVVIAAVDRQLKVIADKSQQQIDLAKAVADAAEKSADRQVDAAERIAKAAGGGLTDESQKAADQADELAASLKDVRREIDQLNAQPLDATQQARYIELLDEASRLEGQLADARRRSKEIVQDTTAEIDKLSDAEREQAEAMADLLKLNRDLYDSGDPLLKRLEEIRLGTLLAGTEQQSYRKELAGTVEGWEKLSEAQKDQLEQLKIFSEAQKRILTEASEDAKAYAEEVQEATAAMAAGWDEVTEACQRTKDCAAGV